MVVAKKILKQKTCVAWAQGAEVAARETVISELVLFPRLQTLVYSFNHLSLSAGQKNLGWFLWFHLGSGLI